LGKEIGNIANIFKEHNIDPFAIFQIVLMVYELMKEDEQFAMDFGAIPLSQLLQVFNFIIFISAREDTNFTFEGPWIFYR
jgi:hypothetical protein